MIKLLKKIIKFQKNWKITLPDFDSHYDELGYIDEDEEDDESGDSEDSAEVFWKQTMMRSQC